MYTRMSEFLYVSYYHTKHIDMPYHVCYDEPGAISDSQWIVNYYAI